MTDELKPVPCGCGGEAKVWMLTEPEKPYIAMCQKCGTTTLGSDTEAEAVEVWNRAMGERTAKVETVEKPNVYKCGDCGQYFHSTAWGSPVLYCSRCGAKLDWSGNE